MTRRIGVALALAVLGTLLLSGVALAAPQRATIEITARAAAKVDRGYVLAVRVRSADGKPVNEAAIRFYEAVDLFGVREMLIGTAMTDGQGDGALVYLPAQVGSHPIIARFAGRDQVAPAEGRITLEATVAAAAYQAQPVPLADFSRVVTGAVGAIVLVVWAFIVFAFISTARGVRSGARDLEKGDHA